MKITNLINYLIIIIFFSYKLTAHDSLEIDTVNYELKPKYGISAAYNLNFHSSSITEINGFNSCCPKFNGGFGTGFTFGGLIDYPIDEMWQISARFGYSSYNGLLKESQVLPVLDITTGSSINATIENRFDVQFGTIGLEPMVSYRLQDELMGHFGFRIAMLVDHHYTHVEEIINPRDKGTFSNGLLTWNVSYGDIPNPNVLFFGLKLGASYDMALDKKRSIFLSPEIFYNLLLTPVMKDLSWNVHQIQIGASLKYRQPPPPPPPPAPPLPPPFPEMPLPPNPPELMANISVVEVDSLGKENKNFSLKIEDFITYNMRPLLNYIFFDSLSSEIPVKYKKLSPRETNNFSQANLQNLGPIETYYQILNIIGERMKNNPETTIKITGTNSNSGDEKNNKALSLDRAAKVKNYLNEAWGIDNSRMTVIARNLPEKFTRLDEPESDSENRRVEIVASDPRITEPVFTVDTMRVLSNYNLRFKPEYEANAGVKNWEVKAVYENKDVASFDGKGNVPKNLDWTLGKDTKNAPKSAGNIFYYLSVTDSLGQTVVSTKNRLPIEQLTIDRKRLERIKDREFEYYSLILFDFGKSDLRSEHTKVVDFIKNRITQNATIYIQGYTDLIGDEDVNKRISEKRAKAVADRLKIENAKVEGLGEQVILYDNSTPEGRYYCRTVQITIETPNRD